MATCFIFNIKRHIDFTPFEYLLVTHITFLEKNFIDRSHTRVCLDKMYKALFDPNDGNRSEFRINPKHAIGTTLLGPGFIFDLNRVVQTFHS